MPKDYLETVQAEEAALHMRLIRPLKNKPFIFNHGYKEDGKFHQVILCCAKRPEAFKTIVGALTAQNMNILEAKIYARKDGVIIISLNIAATVRQDRDNLETWKNLNQNVRDIFEGQKDLSTLLATRTRYISEKKLVGAITPKVSVDNTSDPNFSVVRIEAHDHLGMLYKISKTFADLEVQIHSAKISTQGGRGIDVFYVSQQNKKLLFDKLILRIKERISSAILVKNLEDIG